MAMINIQELREHYQRYSPTLTAPAIKKFIDFIEAEQNKNKKAKVISLEAREKARALKELKDKRAERKPFDPEQDFNNLEFMN